MLDRIASNDSWLVERADAPAFGSAMTAMKLAARIAGDLEDPNLLPIVDRCLSAFTSFSDNETHVQHIVAQAVTDLARLGEPLHPDLQRLSNSIASVRLALAQHTPPSDPVGYEILSSLLDDPDAEVRTAARNSLAKAPGFSWWVGRFSQDPLGGLDPAEVERLEPELKAILEILDLESLETHPRDAELVERARALPDDLLFDLGRRNVRRNQFSLTCPALLSVIFERPRARRELLGWVREECFGDYLCTQRVIALLSTLDASARIEFSVGLAREAVRAPSKATCLPNAIAKLFPVGADLSELLDVLLEASPTADVPRAQLASPIAAEGAAVESIRERVLDAAVSFWPGVWKQIKTVAYNVLDTLSAGVGIAVGAEAYWWSPFGLVAALQRRNA